MVQVQVALEVTNALQHHKVVTASFKMMTSCHIDIRKSDQSKAWEVPSVLGIGGAKFQAEGGGLPQLTGGLGSVVSSPVQSRWDSANHVSVHFELKSQRVNFLTGNVLFFDNLVKTGFHYPCTMAEVCGKVGMSVRHCHIDSEGLSNYLDCLVSSKCFSSNRNVSRYSIM